MGNLIVLVSIVLLQFAVNGSTERNYSADMFCLWDKDDENLNLCPAGTYQTKCGKVKCLRIPGQPCRKYESDLYGHSCHEQSHCGCDGKCHGSLIINGKDHTHSPSCLQMKKRKQIEFPYADNYNENNYLDYPIIEMLD